uniref:Retrotransposon Copia-like N-terminal domain-containing protein n=1 Tax=Fagus sylvatica TaxID=28930 RepID=A0A2N9I154_FAGSY
MAFESLSKQIIASITNSSLDDPPLSSPYYLHASDNSSLMLVNQPFTGDNFHSWFRSMAMGLTIKNKLEFVDGSIGPPKEGITSPLPNSFIPDLSHSLFASNVKLPIVVSDNLWVIDTGAIDHMAFTP